MKEINKQNTLIILDWDDTLFPTNWVMKNGINLINIDNKDQYIEYFRELDDVLYRLLKILMIHGKVVIITNAMPEWIKLSSLVLPKTYYILKKIKIVSARKNYQNITDKMMDWKTLAFRDEIKKEYIDCKYMHVISIGDAEYEYNALISLIKINHECQKLLKAIKFMKDPSHDILVDQVETLIKAVPSIVKKPTHLDLKFDHHSNVKIKPKKQKEDK
jgi:hypothetical protein